MEEDRLLDSSDRIHRAVSADGTEIAARVYGQGPTLGICRWRVAVRRARVPARFQIEG
jgi:hypothetical protein